MRRRELPVTDAADVPLAERAVRLTAGAVDLPGPAVEEVAIVARELAENILAHAQRGSLSVGPCTDDERVGIEIRAVDVGPGIDDIDRATEDGYSTAGGLGHGLGAVHRLMDHVAIGPNEGNRGLQVVATRWGEAATATREAPVDVGAATRPRPGSSANGDAFVIHHGPDAVLAGVIDGLGHGALAHEASDAARRYVVDHASQSIPRLFRGVERACRGTRGVVMALARVGGDGRVAVGSVGNISVRVLDTAEPVNVVTPRGVLGANGPDPVVREWAWERGSTLVMYSDGIDAGWRPESVPRFESGTATQAARRLLQAFAVSRDDATVLVATGVAR